MPRNMSFALTIEQVKNKSKCVTRRQGWNNLEPETHLQPVEKGMGLKPGEKVKKIGGLIRVESIRREPINAITQTDCVLEGFPEMTPDDFIEMYCKANKCKPTDICNRIGFSYV